MEFFGRESGTARGKSFWLLFFNSYVRPESALRWIWFSWCVGEEFGEGIGTAGVSVESGQVEVHALLYPSLLCPYTHTHARTHTHAHAHAHTHTHTVMWIKHQTASTHSVLFCGHKTSQFCIAQQPVNSIASISSNTVLYTPCHFADIKHHTVVHTLGHFADIMHHTVSFCGHKT